METVPQQGYINLVKASWILIDVVVRHPQLSYLDNEVRIEVDALAAVWQKISLPLNDLANGIACVWCCSRIHG
jgi:hypothetical protein